MSAWVDDETTLIEQYQVLKKIVKKCEDEPATDFVNPVERFWKCGQIIWEDRGDEPVKESGET